RDLNSSKKKNSTKSRKIWTNQKTKQPPRNHTRCHLPPKRRSGTMSIQNNSGIVSASAAKRSRWKPLRKASRMSAGDTPGGLKARSKTTRRRIQQVSKERNQKPAKP